MLSTYLGVLFSLFLCFNLDTLFRCEWNGSRQARQLKQGQAQKQAFKSVEMEVQDHPLVQHEVQHPIQNPLRDPLKSKQRSRHGRQSSRKHRGGAGSPSRGCTCRGHRETLLLRNRPHPGASVKALRILPAPLRNQHPLPVRLLVTTADQMGR